MHVSCEEFIKQVRDCPVGIVFARPGQPFVLQRSESAEDDTITGTWTAPDPSTMSEEEYLEFKAKLGAVLTEPAVYQRVAVFGGPGVAWIVEMRKSRGRKNRT
jgi:hypothetical protein